MYSDNTPGLLNKDIFVNLVTGRVLSTIHNQHYKNK